MPRRSAHEAAQSAALHRCARLLECRGGGWGGATLTTCTAPGSERLSLSLVCACVCQSKITCQLCALPHTPPVRLRVLCHGEPLLPALLLQTLSLGKRHRSIGCTNLLEGRELVIAELQIRIPSSPLSRSLLRLICGGVHQGKLSEVGIRCWRLLKLRRVASSRCHMNCSEILTHSGVHSSCE